MRLYKLFLTLWVVVTALLTTELYINLQQYVSKEQVFEANHVHITIGLIKAAKSKSQVASVLAHELSHIQLGHTTSDKHELVDEYNSDLLSIYYSKKANYNICDIKYFWKELGDSYLNLKPSSHPNAQTRAYYMEMPECKKHVMKVGIVSVEDVREIFKNLVKHMEGINRYRTILTIDFFNPSVNAYVYTTTRDK